MSTVEQRPAEMAKDDTFLTLSNDVARELIEVLGRHCGQRGTRESAVETLNRIIAERDSGGFAKVNQSAAIFAFVGWDKALRPWPVSEKLLSKESKSLRNIRAYQRAHCDAAHGGALDVRCADCIPAAENSGARPTPQTISFLDVMAMFTPRPRVYILDSVEGDAIAIERIYSGLAIGAVLIVMSRSLAQHVEETLWNFAGVRFADVADVQAMVVDVKTVVVPIRTALGIANPREAGAKLQQLIDGCRQLNELTSQEPDAR